MPLEVEHLRRDVRSHPDNPRFDTVEHEWTFDLLDRVKTLVEEDGGPNIVAQFYGQAVRHGSVEHTFTADYTVRLPSEEEPEVVFRRGDLVRAARVRR